MNHNNKHKDPASLVEKISTRIVHSFVYGIIAFSIFSVLVCLVVFSVKYSEVFSFKELVWLLPAGAIIFGIYKLSKYLAAKSEKLLIITMVAIGVCSALLMNVAYNTKPCSDYSMIWNAAIKMANGSFAESLSSADYMYHYNWQIGIAFFESIVVRLFGANFFVLKIFNAILMIATHYAIYFMCKKKFGHNVAVYAYVTSALFLPWLLSVPQFTNHHLGILLLLVSLYFLEKKQWWAWCVAGCAAGLLNVVRPMGILIVLTGVCLTVFNAVKAKSFKPLINIVVFVVCFLLIVSAFDILFVELGYADSPVSSAKLKYFKFQKGLYGYNSISQDLESFDYNYNEYNNAMKQELISTVSSSPIQILRFVGFKMVRYLGLFDYQFEMTYNHDVEMYTQYPVKALYSTSWFQYALLLIFAFFGFREYKQKYAVDSYLIFFIGNTLVYFFVEAWSSYRFESYPFLIIFAALGMKAVADKKWNIFKNIKR